MFVMGTHVNRSIPIPLIVLTLAVVFMFALMRLSPFRMKRTSRQLPPPLGEKYAEQIAKIEKSQARFELIFTFITFVMVALTLWGPDWLLEPIGRQLYRRILKKTSDVSAAGRHSFLIECARESLNNIEPPLAGWVEAQKIKLALRLDVAHAVAERLHPR